MRTGYQQSASLERRRRHKAWHHARHDFAHAYMRRMNDAQWSGVRNMGHARVFLEPFAALGPSPPSITTENIHSGFRERRPVDPEPQLLIYSISAQTLLQLAGSGNREALAAYALWRLTALANGAADFAAFASNTPHLVHAAAIVTEMLERTGARTRRSLRR
jgi:hypothetical protein